MTHTLHFEQHGSATFPPMLLLHGFLGSSQDWAEAIKRLSKHYYCITVDLPGHGKSREWDWQSCTFAATAQAILQILDTLNIQRCHLAGYSMGGRLALLLAIQNPARFSHLVIESASPGIIDPVERLQRKSWDLEIAHQLVSQKFEQFLYTWYNQPIFYSLKSFPEFEQMVQQRLQNDPLFLAKAIQCLGSGAQEPLWDKLERLTMPVLYLAGEFDEKYRRIGEQMKSRVPRLMCKTVRGCGHNIHFENPARYAKQVTDFLHAFKHE